MTAEVVKAMMEVTGSRTTASHWPPCEATLPQVLWGSYTCRV